MRQIQSLPITEVPFVIAKVYFSRLNIFGDICHLKITFAISQELNLLIRDIEILV